MWLHNPGLLRVPEANKNQFGYTTTPSRSPIEGQNRYGYINLVFLGCPINGEFNMAIKRTFSGSLLKGVFGMANGSINVVWAPHRRGDTM